MKKLVVVALVGATSAVVAASGCKKKESPAEAGGAGDQGDKPGGAGEKGKPAALAKQRTDNTSSLWALAPEGAVFGLVVGEGAGERMRVATKAHYEELAGKPFGAPLVEAMKEMRDELGFDPFDPAGWKSMGIDASLGAALFVHEDERGEEHPIAILPVVDREAFVAKTKGKKDTVDGKEVDRIEDDMICIAGKRYVCGKHVADIEAVHKGGTKSPLADAVKALPASRRGDVELFADLTRIPEAQEELKELAPVGRVDSVGFAARLEDDGLSFRGWASGKVDGPIGAMLRGGKTSAAVTGKSGGSATVTRLLLPMSLLTKEMPDKLPAGKVDLRADLVDQLTGEVQMASTGKGLLAGTVILGIEDEAKVGGALAGMCELLAGMKASSGGLVAKVEPGDKKCAVEMSFAPLKKELAGLDLPNLTVVYAVDGKALVLTIGEVDPAKLAGSAADDAGSAEAKELLGGSPLFVLWSRALDLDVNAVPLPAELRNELPWPMIVAGLDWFAATFSEIAVGATLGDSGAELVVRVTTFAGDPPEARKAYAAALEKRRGGDREGWKAAVADLAKTHKGTRVGARAQLELDGTPTLGLGSFTVGGVVSAMFLGRKVESGRSRGRHDDDFGIPDLPDDLIDMPGIGGAKEEEKQGGGGFGKKDEPKVLEATPPPAPAPL